MVRVGDATSPACKQKEGGRYANKEDDRTDARRRAPSASNGGDRNRVEALHSLSGVVGFITPPTTKETAP